MSTQTVLLRQCEEVLCRLDHLFLPANVHHNVLVVVLQLPALLQRLLGEDIHLVGALRIGRE